MNKLRNLFPLIRWLFWRLPRWFIFPFVVLVVLWTGRWYELALEWRPPYLEESLSNWLSSWLSSWFSIVLPYIGRVTFPHPIVGKALGDIAIYIVGVLTAYNVAAGINWGVFRLNLKPYRFRYVTRPQDLPYTRNNPSPSSDQDGDDKAKRLRRYFATAKIGLILAGGGAKGAYQAGAMKAIYEFLEKYGGLGSVKVVAGTSIGSWNGLFWFADLMRPAITYKGRKMSVHEYWWNRVNVKALVAPSWYFPLMRNAFLTSKPWQDVYDRLFAPRLRQMLENDLAKKIHFYFTFTEITSGKRKFITNNPAIADARQSDENWQELYRQVDLKNNDQYVQQLRGGVFASMDLPPLFPYFRWQWGRDTEYLEDGGVIDNLPLYFGTGVEDCDLLFVLPLNADFSKEEVDKKSLVLRLFRVLDMRQGELERRGFKTTYLYNEQAMLRKLLSNAFGLGDPPHKENSAEWSKWVSEMKEKLKAASAKEEGGVREDNQAEMDIASRLVERDLRHTNVLAVAPQRPLLIGTAEFWKTKEAGQAFDLMYRETYRLLEKYEFGKTQEKLLLHVVDKKGNVTPQEMF